MSAESAIRRHSRPRPGFKDPETARKVAVIFTAEGATADYFRSGMHPWDGMYAEIADAMEALATERRFPPSQRPAAAEKDRRTRLRVLPGGAR